ncbi:MAG: hydantoinase/oxoprolinase family protein [Methanolinea sp.]|nr:hydantoinase/oxoprolinase family protein [Methanolinea sp.]
MLGIDVGGANVKFATEEGVETVYCPLWKGAPLAEVLSRYRDEGDDGCAVVMSGELADCFSSKAEGIAWIVRAVKGVFPGALFFGTDGAFHRDPDPSLAAANWYASAVYLHTLYPRALLVDMGSTTTDIVPLSSPGHLRGLSDLGRLRRGYLLYTGLLRTPVPAVIRSATVGGIPTPVSAEYFAQSADAHLVLGHIREEDYTCDTPDGRGKDRGSCLRRLARVVCADLEEIGAEGATDVAVSFWEAQGRSVREAVDAARCACGAKTVVAAGTGSRLVSSLIPARDLSRDLGDAAAALPAHAVMEVMRRGLSF